MSSEESSGSSISATQMSSTFKVLIASDIHIGYNERHHLRGDDSFRSFEEVLQAAAKHNVDFILLAGDLFHVNKPPMSTINRTIELIRKYCFGEPDSDPCNPRFKIGNFKNANFLDPNLRVKYPIFTIHGNHDDPTGVEQTSVIDILASSGLVNYFGKRTKVDEVTLNPIILKKGPSKIALYGLGSMHEERLANIFRTGRFNYLQPDDPSNYLKIVVVHQNRVPHPNTKYLNPDDLEELPDLVVWGHEHECIDRLEYYDRQKFYILQPGSTVATSLSDSEVAPKHYSIMTVAHDELSGRPKMKVNFYRLETARPFAMTTFTSDEIIASNRDGFRNTKEAQDYIYSFCKNEVEEMIQTLNAESMAQEPMLPLVRLRILFSNVDHQFDPKIFQQEYTERVANSEELIRFVKRNKRIETKEAFVDYGQDLEIEEMLEMLDDEVMQKQMQIGDVMNSYFEKLPERDQTSLFSPKYLTEQVIDFIRKENTDPLPEMLASYQAVVKATLSEMHTCEASHFDAIDLKKEIRAIKDKFEASSSERRKLDKLIHDKLMGKKTEGAAKVGGSSGWSDHEVDNEDEASVVVKKRPTTKRAAAKKFIKDEEDEEDQEEEEEEKPNRGRRPAAKKIVIKEEEEEEDLEDEEEKAYKKPTRGRGGGRAVAGTTRGRGRGKAVKKKEDDEEGDDTEASSNKRSIASYFSKR